MSTTHYAIFGRFNIWHGGHSSMLNGPRANGSFTIGIANSSRNLRDVYARLMDIRAIEPGTYDTLICNNLFQFLDVLCSEHEHVTLILGTDRFVASRHSLEAYFPNLTIVEAIRAEDGPSSSLCRRLYTEANGDIETLIPLYLQHGLCRTIYEARIMHQATQDELVYQRPASGS